MKLITMQKRGQARVNNKISYLIGALVVVVMAVAVAPQMFDGLNDLANTTLNPDVPTWLPTVLFVIVGAGILFLIWRAFDGS